MNDDSSVVKLAGRTTTSRCGRTRQRPANPDLAPVDRLVISDTIKLFLEERADTPTYSYFAQLLKRHMEHLVRVLRMHGSELGVEVLVENAEPEVLMELAKELPQEQGQAALDYLDGISTGNWEVLSVAAQGVIQRMCVGVP